jgi:hypothetical protein
VSYFDTDILHELIAKLHKQNANKDKRITELEKAVLYAIDTCCLDEEHEIILADVLAKGGGIYE